MKLKVASRFAHGRFATWKIRHTSVIPVLLACNFGHHFRFKLFNYPDVDMEDSPHIFELLISARGVWSLIYVEP